MTDANKFIRSFIGEPHSTMLDAAVTNTFGGPSIDQALYQLTSLVNGFQVSGPDPVWGSATIDEVVNARLGAMGVV